MSIFAEAVAERCGGRFIDDAQNVETGDATGIARRLALSVVEVSRHGDDGLFDLLANIIFGNISHLRKNKRRNLLRAVFFIANFDTRCFSFARAHGHDIERNERLEPHDFWVIDRSSDEAFHGKNGILGILCRLSFGHLPDECIAGIRKCDDRWRRSRSFAIGNDDDIITFHDRYAGVRRTEIDTDDFRHRLILYFVCCWLL